MIKVTVESGGEHVHEFSSLYEAEREIEDLFNAGLDEDNIVSIIDMKTGREYGCERRVKLVEI